MNLAEWIVAAIEHGIDFLLEGLQEAERADRAVIMQASEMLESIADRYRDDSKSETVGVGNGSGIDLA